MHRRDQQLIQLVLFLSEEHTRAREYEGDHINIAYITKTRTFRETEYTAASRACAPHEHNSVKLERPGILPDRQGLVLGIRAYNRQALSHRPLSYSLTFARMSRPAKYRTNIRPTVKI